MSQQTTDHGTKMKSLRAALFGNVLEFFDWTIFALFSTYIADAVFDSDDPTAALLQTLAIFAVSFVARPVGGFVFGRIADKYGRKNSLALAMIAMGIGSLLIATIPTHATAGVVGPILLLLARIIQGLAHGGESAAAYVYVSELAPPRRRGLWSSSIFFSASVGTIAGTLLGAFMTNMVSAEAMQAWGWRIPFVVGSLLAGYALYIRIRSVETEIGTALVSGERAEQTQPADADSPRRSRRAVLVILLKLLVVVGAANVAFYTWITFAASYAISSLDMSESGAFAASLIAQLLGLGLFPVFGLLSDRVGRKPIAIFSLVGFGLFSYPFSWILSSDPLSLFAVQLVSFVFWAAIASILPSLLSESLSSTHRAVGVGVVGSLAAAIFGGTAPFLNSWLTSIDMGWVFIGYTTVVLFAGAAVVATLRETRDIDLVTMDIAQGPHDREEGPVTV
ncbi:MFS transporter [Rhodococcus rhodochrous]|uniref:MFS transporter n=1 Tax=Rhodococcus rhodochrous TaxID=1829 RepID=A0AA46X2C8_RHORH|nr:MFS transporter [Rhodococcus rhodochrous]UZF48227.1 MFS transporter [Rhodococcus rhodochrous]